MGSERDQAFHPQFSSAKGKVYTFQRKEEILYELGAMKV
jgi:hypothetical protein